jgi:hypothetical protein
MSSLVDRARLDYLFSHTDLYMEKSVMRTES